MEFLISMDPTRMVLDATLELQQFDETAPRAVALMQAGFGEAEIAKWSTIQAWRTFVKLDLRRSWFRYQPALRKVLLLMVILRLVNGQPSPVTKMAESSGINERTVRRHIARRPFTRYLHRVRLERSDKRRAGYVLAPAKHPENATVRALEPGTAHSPASPEDGADLGTILRGLIEENRLTLSLDKMRELVSVGRSILTEALQCCKEMMAVYDDPELKGKLLNLASTLQAEFLERINTPEKEAQIAADLFERQSTVLDELEADVARKGGYAAFSRIRFNGTN